jgi:hypothetical protein
MYENDVEPTRKKNYRGDKSTLSLNIGLRMDLAE